MDGAIAKRTGRCRRAMPLCPSTAIFHGSSGRSNNMLHTTWVVLQSTVMNKASAVLHKARSGTTATPTTKVTTTTTTTTTTNHSNNNSPKDSIGLAAVGPPQNANGWCCRQRRSHGLWLLIVAGKCGCTERVGDAAVLQSTKNASASTIDKQQQ